MKRNNITIIRANDKLERLNKVADELRNVALRSRVALILKDPSDTTLMTIYLKGLEKDSNNVMLSTTPIFLRSKKRVEKIIDNPYSCDSATICFISIPSLNIMENFLKHSGITKVINLNIIISVISTNNEETKILDDLLGLITSRRQQQNQIQGEGLK